MKAIRDRNTFNYDQDIDVFDHLKYHKDRMKQVHHTINNETPKTYLKRSTVHARRDVKDKQRLLEKQNFILAKSLQQIMNGQSKVDSATYKLSNTSEIIDTSSQFTNYQIIQPGSLNRSIRKKTANKIHEQNLIKAARLEGIKPVYTKDALTIKSPLTHRTKIYASLPSSNRSSENKNTASNFFKHPNSNTDLVSMPFNSRQERLFKKKVRAGLLKFNFNHHNPHYSPNDYSSTTDDIFSESSINSSSKSTDGSQRPHSTNGDLKMEKVYTPHIKSPTPYRSTSANNTPNKRFKNISHVNNSNNNNNNNSALNDPDKPRSFKKPALTIMTNLEDDDGAQNYNDKNDNLDKDNDSVSSSIANENPNFIYSKPSILTNILLSYKPGLFDQIWQHTVKIQNINKYVKYEQIVEFPSYQQHNRILDIMIVRVVEELYDASSVGTDNVDSNSYTPFMNTTHNSTSSDVDLTKTVNIYYIIYGLDIDSNQKFQTMLTLQDLSTLLAHDDFLHHRHSDRLKSPAANLTNNSEQSKQLKLNGHTPTQYLIPTFSPSNRHEENSVLNDRRALMSILSYPYNVSRGDEANNNETMKTVIDTDIVDLSNVELSETERSDIIEHICLQVLSLVTLESCENFNFTDEEMTELKTMTKRNKISRTISSRNNSSYNCIQKHLLLTVPEGDNDEDYSCSPMADMTKSELRTAFTEESEGHPYEDDFDIDENATATVTASKVESSVSSAKNSDSSSKSGSSSKKSRGSGRFTPEVRVPIKDFKMSDSDHSINDTPSPSASTTVEEETKFNVADKPAGGGTQKNVKFASNFDFAHIESFDASNVRRGKLDPSVAVVLVEDLINTQKKTELHEKLHQYLKSAELSNISRARSKTPPGSSHNDRIYRSYNSGNRNKNTIANTINNTSAEVTNIVNSTSPNDKVPVFIASPVEVIAIQSHLHSFPNTVSLGSSSSTSHKIAPTIVKMKFPHQTRVEIKSSILSSTQRGKPPTSSHDDDNNDSHITSAGDATTGVTASKINTNASTRSPHIYNYSWRDKDSMKTSERKTSLNQLRHNKNILDLKLPLQNLISLTPEQETEKVRKVFVQNTVDLILKLGKVMVLKRHLLADKFSSMKLTVVSDNETANMSSKSYMSDRSSQSQNSYPNKSSYNRAPPTASNVSKDNKLAILQRKLKLLSTKNTTDLSVSRALKSTNTNKSNSNSNSKDAVNIISSSSSFIERAMKSAKAASATNYSLRTDTASTKSNDTEISSQSKITSVNNTQDETNHDASTDIVVPAKAIAPTRRLVYRERSTSPRSETTLIPTAPTTTHPKNRNVNPRIVTSRNTTPLKDNNSESHSLGDNHSTSSSSETSPYSQPTAPSYPRPSATRNRPTKTSIGTRPTLLDNNMKLKNVEYIDTSPLFL